MLGKEEGDRGVIGLLGAGEATDTLAGEAEGAPGLRVLRGGADEPLQVTRFGEAAH